MNGGIANDPMFATQSLATRLGAEFPAFLWQSDTPGKTGRFLVRDALQEAIEQLKEAPDIEEPTAQANREALHHDHDVKGVTAS